MAVVPLILSQPAALDRSRDELLRALNGGRHPKTTMEAARESAVSPFRATAFTQVEFTLLLMEFSGAAEFSFDAKRGKENPSLKEGKSKPWERKIQASGRKIQGLSFRELSLFKGLR